MKYALHNAYYFAQGYGTCNYGQGAYQNNSCQTSGSTNPSASSSQNGGLLVNTGLAISAILILVAVIIITSLVVRFWRRRSAPKMFP